MQGCKSLFEVGGLFYGREAISSFSGGAYAVFSCFRQILGGAIAPVAPRDLHPCPRTLTTLTLTLTDHHDAFESLCAPLFCDFIQNYFAPKLEHNYSHFVFKTGLDSPGKNLRFFKNRFFRF